MESEIQSKIVSELYTFNKEERRRKNTTKSKKSEK